MDKILGIIRHILTFAGGYLAGQGLIDEGQIEVVVGAIITIIGVIWSALQKSDKFPMIK
jgi:hypothetical protein